jgi:cytochrome c oxidase subunit 2
MNAFVARALRVLPPALGLLVLTLAGAAHAGEVQPEGTSIWGFEFPRDISLEGWRIDWLIEVTSVFVILLFVIMCIWLFGAVFLYGEKHEALYDHGNARNQTLVALTLSSVVFFVVDGNLFYNSVIDLTEAFWNFDRAENIEGERRPDCGVPGVDPTHCAVRIEINARQWAWQGRFSGLDGEFNTADDVEILNDFKIPVGQHVILQMASVDVIHAFYLPNLRMKQDATPGHINHMWFQAMETGDFDIGCAQHCGTHHYKMKGKLTVLPLDEWTAWHEEASKAAAITFNPADTDSLWGWEWRNASGKKKEDN